MKHDTSTSESSSEENRREEGEEVQRHKTGSKTQVERNEKIFALAKEGLTAGQIGRKLQVSRNVVIGVLYRAGIKLARSGSHAFNTVKRHERPPKAKGSLPLKPPRRPKAEWETLPSGPKAEFHGYRSAKLVEYEQDPPVSLMDLGAGQCRWPIGEGLAEFVGFCGKAATERYCPVHMKVNKYGSVSL